jgi:hypothetical protein
MKTITSLSELSQQAVEDFKKLQSVNAEELQKAGVNLATGLTAYDLQAPAKNLYPVLTPIRNMIPRVSGGGGSATNWKRVTAINSSRMRAGVPEGTRNGVMSITTDPKSANYASLGMEDSVTFEAEDAAKGFEDIRATEAQRLLWSTMIEEELFSLGGNVNVALGTPTAPTVTVVNGGGTVPDDATGYAIKVVALTLHGADASSLAGGVVGEVSVTPADGSAAFTYGGGSSAPSSQTATGAISNGNDSILRASTPVIAGAVAYAWYVGVTGGNLLLQAITYINSVELTSLVTSGLQNVTAITADKSVNAYGYDGLLYHAWGAGSNAYIKNMATGTPGAGTGLTASGKGTITEIDEMLDSMWTNYKLIPDKIWVHAQEIQNITSKIFGGTANGALRYTVPLQGDEMVLSAGISKVKYQSLLGRVIPIEVHPHITKGTILAATTALPYPMANVPNVFEMRLQRDYMQYEWPLRTRKYESGVYFRGVLAHYFPPSLGIITNIADA